MAEEKGNRHKKKTEGAAAAAAPEATSKADTQDTPQAEAGSTAQSAELEEKVAGLEAKLAEAEKSVADGKDQLLRTTAEYENFRRRSRAEHDAAFGNGVAHATEQLLPVLDVLSTAAQSPTVDEEYKKGVLMTLQKCDEVFKKLGIQEIAAEGQPFDPEMHNACMQEACDGVPSGCVTRVMQKGYTLNGRVIRHAVVAVAP